MFDGHSVGYVVVVSSLMALYCWIVFTDEKGSCNMLAMSIYHDSLGPNCLPSEIYKTFKVVDDQSIMVCRNYIDDHKI